MQTVRIAGRDVSRVGYGTMQLAGPGAMGPPIDEDRATDALRAAVDAGVRLIDTSGYYGPTVANHLLAKTLHPYGSDLVIATKVGALRTPAGGFVAASDPAQVRAAVLQNLRELRLDRLDLVHARYMPDTSVPFADTVGALAALQDEGLVGQVGVSNVDLTQLAEARSVVEIASVENEYRLGLTDGREVLEATARDDIPYLAYRPLGNGSLARSDSPIAQTARRAGLPTATLALAWLLDQAPNLAVIPGTSDPAHVPDLVAARDVVLDDGVREALTRWPVS